MTELFCCTSIKPYRPQRLDHEVKVNCLTQWAKYASSNPSNSVLLNSNLEYAVRLVKQVNFGPQESIRFFTPAIGGTGFIEITENDLLEASFEKLYSYKNFKCDWHNKFFEVNLYQKDPINRHHWVNEELGLGLGLESAWEAQLICYNISNFIFDYSQPSAAGLITFLDVNEWVDTALGMTLKSTLWGTPGLKQFQEVVDTLIKLCGGSEWASKCEEDVMRTFSAGPNQQFLDSL